MEPFRKVLRYNIEVRKHQIHFIQNIFLKYSNGHISFIMRDNILSSPLVSIDPKIDKQLFQVNGNSFPYCILYPISYRLGNNLPSIKDRMQWNEIFNNVVVSPPQSKFFLAITAQIVWISLFCKILVQIFIDFFF